MATLIRDTDYYIKIQCFAPISGITIPTSYTPSKDNIVKIGADVTITIGGVDVAYTKGDVIGVKAGTAYTLSAATLAHVM